MEKVCSPKRPKTWNSSRRGQIPVYVYKTLQDIHNSDNIKEIHNVYGVVIDSRPVEKSKGSDFFCILRIVDPSYCQGDGVKVTLFHRIEKHLPKIEQWDIIRLHRVRSTFYKGSLALMSTRGWSWVVWKGKASSESEDVIDVASSASTTLTLLNEDKEKVKALRNWVIKRGYMNLNQAQNASENGENLKLADLKSGSFFNLVCQVTGMAKIKKDFVILKVWDGTLPSHKIEPGAYSEDAEIRILSNMDDIEHYMVDVSVFDNHVQTIEEDEIELGSFVRFCNLHASPKSLHSNDSSEDCSELFLHGGIVFNRGIVTLDEDNETTFALKKAMRDVLNAYHKFDVTPEADNNTPARDDDKIAIKRKHEEATNSPITTKKKKDSDEASVSEAESEFVTPPQHTQKNILKLSENADKNASQNCIEEPVTHVQQLNTDTNVQSQDTLSLLVSMDSPSKTPKSCAVQMKNVSIQVGESFASPSMPTSPPYNSDGSETFSDANMDSQDMRCHQKSSTVVFGENSPTVITSIRSVLEAEVPLRKSKLFRVRAKVIRCSDPKNIVFHYCPATGLRLAAKNDGKPIELTADIHSFVSTWRQVCQTEDGVDSGDSTSRQDHKHEGRERFYDSQNITSTQWIVVPGDNTDNDQAKIMIENYDNIDDGSRWESMKINSNISRKRKLNKNVFHILYRKDPDCTGDLQSFSKNFHRVIRHCSNEALTSTCIPSVAFQDGIYYYCSPACVGIVAVPSLSHEARTFDERKPRFALGCPVLPIIFHVRLLLEDDSDVLEATLKGEQAVMFFNGVTPEQYLLNRDGCRELISEEMSRLTDSSENRDNGTVWAEMVIEKKSRRALPGNDGPVTLYEIINTRWIIDP